MTLILGYINDEFVIMAADRRVSTTVGKLIDDGFTKTAIIYGRYIAGFTGLAKLGQDQQTMEWFVKTVAKYENPLMGQKDGEIVSSLNLSKIARDATNIMLKLTIPKIHKRLSILMIGYDDKGQKLIIYITNMHSDTGEVLTEARDEFIYRVERINLNATIKTIGQKLSKEISERLMSQLRSTRGTKLPSAKRVSNILAGTIERSANRSISSTALITTNYRNEKQGTFDVVTPGAKPGQSVDIASPYVLFPGGAIIVMPSQKLRKSKRRFSNNS